MSVLSLLSYFFLMNIFEPIKFVMLLLFVVLVHRDL